MIDLKTMGYVVKDYQKKKTFASFLSGIAGRDGIPMWAFYVNRGQLVAGFGVRDKNGAIMEFFPANAAYAYVSTIGFRTFVKCRGKIHEFFLESSTGQTLEVRPDMISITEENSSLGLKVKVTYFTIPNENLAALARKVEIENTGHPADIEIVDGLAQILPAGIDYGGYKAISNLLQSWMQSMPAQNGMYYKLRASTSDSSIVKEKVDVNFFTMTGKGKKSYINDPRLIFGSDTSMKTPYGFMEKSFEELSGSLQPGINQVPSAFGLVKLANMSGKSTLYEVYGYADDKEKADRFCQGITSEYFDNKFRENEIVHGELLETIETHTAKPQLDAYFGQCYLDNILRGGKPIVFDTKEGRIGYHLFSRKHGDLERDYNFFSLEPKYYSQGNGNFRDVVQNRRNDLLFEPDLEDFNIGMFASMIQADGYNPLEIRGLKFLYTGDISKQPKELAEVLSREFTPGEAYEELVKSAGEPGRKLSDLLKESKPEIKASYGEGYWEDHFTYILDLAESYLGIWPDKEEAMLFSHKYPYFKSPVEVRPRREKHVLRPDGLVRQYHSLKHLEMVGSCWLEADGHPVESDLYGKFLTLAINKFGHLDPEGVGLSYEADRPGWNDALNGIPGLFGSGISEAIELHRLVRFLQKATRKYPDRKTKVLLEVDALAEKLLAISEGLPAFAQWDRRMEALESYRENIRTSLGAANFAVAHWLPILEKMGRQLELGLARAQKMAPILPTYLYYEAVSYEVLADEEGRTLKNEDGFDLVKVHSFKSAKLPPFLEAPARLLQSKVSESLALEMYGEIKNSGLYDKKLGIYQTSVSLAGCSPEIGRIRAFTPGWLERESDFLHMTYKYLLGLLKSGLYAEFYKEMETNFPCFMDPDTYGRSPLENSSFIATSANPDPVKWGQGFSARLSGSTAEAISMWQLMFIGPAPFRLVDGKLAFVPEPILHHSLFKNNKVSFRLFNKTIVTYHITPGVSTYDPGMKVQKIVLDSIDGTKTINDRMVMTESAQDIRAGKVLNIDIYIF